MFTGIVEEVGQIVSRQGDILSIKAGLVPEAASVGNSIAVNGTCLTSTSRAGDVFSVDVSPETSRRTNLGVLKPGDVVNLERPLSYGGLMGGHFVQGHVDSTSMVSKIYYVGRSWLINFKLPKKFKKNLVQKGSITINGVSLTIAKILVGGFRIAVIPQTLKLTSLIHLKEKDVVNIEFDVLGKYIKSFFR